MNAKRLLTLCFALTLCAGLQAQQEAPTKAMPPLAPTTRIAYYIDVAMSNVNLILPDPPALDSVVNKAELAELHRIEQTRTPDEVEKAKADEAEEDVFIFKSVFGPGFTAQELPLTAALGTHVKNEQGVIGSLLKRHFQRLRPYQVDATLHPVCELKTVHDSYPSGHALTGYLEAFTLAELIPEKRTQILARADDYAHNREVCGVHYPSDVEASRKVAYAVFGYMLGTPRFQKDLESARQEIRAKLGLPEKKD